jgi:hypothetical protein
MIYRNSELRLDQIVTYLNEEKINLSPIFQRGHVWGLKIRQKLLQNIVKGKPIPAIFLYKQATGSKYTYNILDGKQRLESIILFVSNERPDLSIPNWKRYFSGEKQRKEASFTIELSDGEKAFAELDEAKIRDLREYAIPTIEITLDDESTLDDMISLFVDINQQGVRVNRFDIVKAMGRNDVLLADVFDLVAIKQMRGEDIFYRTRRTPFTNILKMMNVIKKISDPRAQVDRMWELLLEIVLFARTNKHKKPVEILKGFISKPDKPSPRLTAAETQRLRKVFKFLGKAYGDTALADTPMATEQAHFYSMVTSIIGSDLLTQYGAEILAQRLALFGQILDGKTSLPNEHPADVAITKYRQIVSAKTTDVGRREERQKQLIAAVAALGGSVNQQQMSFAESTQ